METVKENEVFEGETLIEVEPEQVEPAIGVVTAVRLNIRSAPSTTAKVVAVVPIFTELLIDPEEIDEWYKVCTASGIEGFCMKEFIEIQK